MEFRFKNIVDYAKKDKLTFGLIALFLVLIAVALLSSCGSSSKDATPITSIQTTIPVTTTQVTTPPTTATPTTTMPDLSGVDWVALAREQYGKCGEWHNLAISVGWPEEEWNHLQQVIYRESRCQAEAWNGSDGGLTQINRVHTQWLSDMGYKFPDDMFDAEKNLTFAFRLWETSGWKPWKSSGSTFGA